MCVLEPKYTPKLLSLCIISMRANFHLKSASCNCASRTEIISSTVKLQLKFCSSWQIMQTRCVIEVGNYHQPAAKSSSNSQTFTFTGAGDKQAPQYISELRHVSGATERRLTATPWPFHLTSKMSCSTSKTMESEQNGGWKLMLLCLNHRQQQNTVNPQDNTDKPLLGQATVWFQTWTAEWKPDTSVCLPFNPSPTSWTNSAQLSVCHVHLRK